jgi:hypothetical protein
MGTIAERFPDPREYLNRVERLLVGWSVARAFNANAPRFAKWQASSGPHAAAYFSASQTFSMYAWLFGLPGVIFGVAGLSNVAAVLYILAGACVLWGLARAMSALKPQREYRRARAARDEPR